MPSPPAPPCAHCHASRYALRIYGYVGFLSWRLVELRVELFAPSTLATYLPVLLFHLLGCAMQVRQPDAMIAAITDRTPSVTEANAATDTHSQAFLYAAFSCPN